MDLQLRDRLQAALKDDFSLGDELGGGMSRVFSARDERLGRRIVVKVLPPEMTGALTEERFQREIALIAQLRHPHIVPLLEVGRAADCLYYTMPYIEGESLRARLRKDGVLPSKIAIRYAAEIADALSCAHARGIVHRDIKPENVLLDGDHAVVTDFGIARALDADRSRITHTGAAIGTIAYMSPEQAVADPDVDARTDVYSLGCVLYEMLTGRPPLRSFPPVSLPDWAQENGVGEPIPRDLVPVLRRALAPNPADRFPNAAELRDALLQPRALVSRGWPLSRRSAAGVAIALTLIAAVWRALQTPGVCEEDMVIVSGRAVDGGGRPLSGVDAWVPPMTDAVLTLDDGTFRISVPNAQPLTEVTVRVRAGANARVHESRAELRGCEARSGNVVVSDR